MIGNIHPVIIKLFECIDLFLRCYLWYIVNVIKYCILHDKGMHMLNTISDPINTDWSLTYR